LTESNSGQDVIKQESLAITPGKRAKVVRVFAISPLFDTP